MPAIAKVLTTTLSYGRAVCMRLAFGRPRAARPQNGTDESLRTALGVVWRQSEKHGLREQLLGALHEKIKRLEEEKNSMDVTTGTDPAWRAEPRALPQPRCSS